MTEESADPRTVPGTPGAEPSTTRTATQQLTDALMEFINLSRSFMTNETLRLNHAQYAILSRLEDCPDVTLTAMADSLGYDLSVLSRQAAALTEQGLVVRTKDPRDGRAWMISLTDVGRERLTHARSKRLGMVLQALAPYSDQERAIAARILASFNTGLSETLKRKGVPLG